VGPTFPIFGHSTAYKYHRAPLSIKCEESEV
jgi:hypothetical protein